MMGKISFFLGPQIYQSPGGIFIHQSKYALESLKKYGFESYDPVDTPMVEKSKLDEDKEGKLVDPSHYCGMIGTLLYLTASRLDLQFSICMCARYQARPTKKHLHAVKRIFRYLRGTVNRGLWYPKDSLTALTVFADANHTGCQDTRRSTSGCQSALDPRKTILSTAHAKIDVCKRKITLRVEEEKIIFKSIKHASSLIKRVYMLSLRERMELDLEARLMGETLMLNKSLDHFFGDYIELNDLNVSLELRRYQVDDLMLIIEKCKVIKEFRDRNDARMFSKIFGYHSDCDNDKKICIDCALNLKFSCMIGFEFLHANSFPILYVNVLSKKFYNSIRKEKLEYKENNVVGALMNIPIFVGSFSILIDFAILEDMDTYHDKGMGDVIFGEPFLREVRINARRFEGMIPIYNGNEEVTYQMARSHPRFKHHTNEQFNKILPLLNMSKEDMMNEISCSYQKLKSFYNGVLNLGPEYARDAKMEEWLIRDHISMHEIE
uniref:Uncharacterized mitochondrial protein AtMg00810-like n=1 Tax=Tanacetum cinerariifolium TaxID=118510 RepID=A0A6L2P386_TANCI|nr:uncharacterized mitochondrial protein AtMg00810-like [Tanacetum cinerariifolium]